MKIHLKIFAHKIIFCRLFTFISNEKLIELTYYKFDKFSNLIYSKKEVFKKHILFHVKLFFFFVTITETLCMSAVGTVKEFKLSAVILANTCGSGSNKVHGLIKRVRYHVKSPYSLYCARYRVNTRITVEVSLLTFDHNNYLRIFHGK